MTVKIRGLFKSQLTHFVIADINILYATYEVAKPQDTRPDVSHRDIMGRELRR